VVTTERGGNEKRRSRGKGPATEKKEDSEEVSEIEKKLGEKKRREEKWPHVKKHREKDAEAPASLST